MTDCQGPFFLHRARTRVVVAVGFAVVDTTVTLVGASWWPAHPSPLAWSMLVLQALACLSLLFSRKAPLAVVAVFAGFSLALDLLVSPAGLITPEHANVWAPYATALASYLPIGSRISTRRAILVITALTIIVARPWDPSFLAISIGLLRTGVGPLLAMNFESRRRLVQALTERAERAERERHLLAEQARADERARLAGEMHDVVTHRVSLMVLQAGALRITATDEATRQAAEELRAAGCQALDELRDLVGILRAAGPSAQPRAAGEAARGTEPSPSGLGALVAEWGADAELIEHGDPTLASPVVARTAYRIVREALTNAGKHSPGARVVVTVHYEPAQVEVSVRNTAPTRELDAALANTGSGLGIAGLRQRLELVHGQLRAGPTGDGGFCVEAVLPAYVPTAEAVSS